MAAAAPIPSRETERDFAHEALIMRARELTQQLKDAPDTSRLARWRDRLRAALAETPLPAASGRAPEASPENTQEATT